jgi:hypothetical protein
MLQDHPGIRTGVEMKRTSIINRVGFVAAMLLCMGVVACRGSGESIKKCWAQKQGYSQLQLYTSSDLVGQAYVEEINLDPSQTSQGEYHAILSVVFTNVLKGEKGNYQIYIHSCLRDPDHADLSLFSSEPTREEMVPICQGKLKWKEGDSCIMICSSNPIENRWEMDSAITEGWTQYVRKLREQARRRQYWRAEKKAQRRALSKKMDIAREDMELGDITQEEYEKRYMEYQNQMRPYSSELTDDYIKHAEGVGMYWAIDWGFLEEELEEIK